MKQLILAIVTVCAMACLLSPSASADSPQPGILQMTLASRTVSLGEPIILVYKVTNVESRKIDCNINDNPRKWLSATLIDPFSHSIGQGAITAQAPTQGGFALSQESMFGANGSSTDSVTGSIIVNQASRPVYAGRYHLRLTTQQKYYWDEAAGEPTVVHQDFLLPITVTPKDAQRLHARAEKFRQSVLHDTDYQLAVEALFSMQDSDCLLVWRELATDPGLDAFRATDVINELSRVNSVSATDLLAEMQPIAPERWARTGLDPLNALEGMRRNAGPTLVQHINHLLVAAGVKLDHVPYGSVN